MKVILVCGSPGSGKSYYVKKNKLKDDIVIDIDSLYYALTYLPLYQKPKSVLKYISSAKEAVFKEITEDQSGSTAWIITCGARAESRQRFKDRFNARVIILETPVNKCLEHISSDETRSIKSRSDWKEAVLKWHSMYELIQTDEVISWKE